MPTEHPDLHALQRWMLSVITHPGGARAGLCAARDADAARTPTPEPALAPQHGLSAEARLDLYASTYWSRLIGVLARDFPAVARTLGARRFTELTSAYAAARPSRSYRLAVLGRHLPEFLADVRGLSADLRWFLADLARLERAISEATDEIESSQIEPEDLVALSPEAWASVHLKTIAALRLVAVDHPVARYHDAVLAGANPPIPTRSPRWLVIWRRDFTVYRAEIDRWQYTILSAIDAGHSLGAAIEQCLALPGAEPITLQRELGSWFAQWTADGLFARVDVAA